MGETAGDTSTPPKCHVTNVEFFRSIVELLLSS